MGGLVSTGPGTLEANPLVLNRLQALDTLQEVPFPEEPKFSVREIKVTQLETARDARVAERSAWRACTLAPPPPRQLRITQCPVRWRNRTYTRSGSANGRPRWQSDLGQDVEWADGRWWILDYYVWSDAGLPPARGWGSWMGGAPRMRVSPADAGDAYGKETLREHRKRCLYCIIMNKLNGGTPQI